MMEKPAPLATPRLLLVDDDRELGELLTEYLGAAGFSLAVAHDGQQGLRLAQDGDYALIVLDVMLPGLDGLEVLRRIRARSAQPVLMLTARGDDIDRIVGLEIGADDYLPKPFNPRELVARIHAILRRTAAAGTTTGPVDTPPILAAGDLELDGKARHVRCGGRAVDLTGAEFALLQVLLQEAGRVVTRDELGRTVLGRRLEPFDRSLDMHISNLRRKLGPGPGNSERIKTVRGHGYIYVLAGAPPAGEAEFAGPG